jgi:hypothetical protein
LAAILDALRTPEQRCHLRSRREHLEHLERVSPSLHLRVAIAEALGPCPGRRHSLDTSGREVRYPFPPQAQRFAQALARRKGENWHLVLVEGGLAALSRRNAQANLVAGFEKKSLAGRAPVPFDEARPLPGNDLSADTLQRVAEECPGELIKDDVDLPPGGNEVRSCLDFVAPRTAHRPRRFARRSRRSSARFAVTACRLPASLGSGGIRLDMNRGRHPRRAEESAALRDRGLGLLERCEAFGRLSFCLGPSLQRRLALGAEFARSSPALNEVSGNLPRAYRARRTTAAVSAACVRA